MSDRICLQCEKPLASYQKKYCSYRCTWDAQTIHNKELQSHCEQCGKELGRGQSRFCSRDCYSAFVIEQHKNEPLQTALSKLWHEGISTAEIGRRLKISKNAVIGKAHRWGLPARPSPIRPAIPDIPSIKTPFFVHEERATEGWEPLRPMHSISWGAIAL